MSAKKLKVGECNCYLLIYYNCRLPSKTKLAIYKAVMNADYKELVNKRRQKNLKKVDRKLKCLLNYSDKNMVNIFNFIIFIYEKHIRLNPEKL